MKHLPYFTNNSFSAKHVEDALGIRPNLSGYWRDKGYIPPAKTLGSGNYILLTGEEFLRIGLFKHLLERGFSHILAKRISEAFNVLDWGDIIQTNFEYFAVTVDREGAVNKWSNQHGTGGLADIVYDLADDKDGGIEVPSGHVLVIINALSLCRDIDEKLEAMVNG